MGVVACVSASASAPMAAAGQETPIDLTIEARWSADEFLSSRASLELALSRRLEAPGERIALLLGSTDVSALLEVRATHVRYHPRAQRLPAGRSEAIAFLVTPDGAWRELGRFPLNVRTRLGLDQGSIVPAVELNSNGQLDQGVGAGQPPPERRSWQDLTLRVGVDGAVARDGWQFTTRANALGATREAERLRFNELQLDAPAIDLSDYQVQLARGSSRLSLGTMAVGSHRYLLNGFSSRGVGGAVQLGRVAALEAAVVNGTNVVGWSNLLGVAKPSHRMSSVSLGLELLPHRPGAIQIGIDGFDGSVLPMVSFNEGATVDAETSRGFGLRIGLSDATQRIRFAAGIARSRFTNPADPLLAGDTTLVPVRATTRTARYGELDLRIFQGMLTPSLPVMLTVAARHERIEPLYRSIGAYVQADMETDGIDVAGSLGPLSLQASLSAARDNLDHVASILTTRTHNRAVSAMLPLTQLASPGAWFWPTLTATWQQTEQTGEGVPVNGDFQPSHVPDQSSDNQSAGVAWAGATWTAAYRWNRSTQDNRQAGREQADFRATVHSVALTVSPAGWLSTSLDLSTEEQEHLETGTTQRLDRLAGAMSWQLPGRIGISASTSLSWGSDPFARQRTRWAEYHVELSQGFNLYRRTETGTQGRIFLRYGRSNAVFRPFDRSVLPAMITWDLSAGASFRLY